MRNRKGIVIIFILLLLILISLMSINLFNKGLLNFKVASRRNAKELVLYETESCLSTAEINIINLANPTENNIHNFSFIDFKSASDEWWKNNGLACNEQIFTYTQLLQSFSDKNEYFYQITVRYLNGVILQVVVSKNFTTGTAQQTSWVNLS